MRSAFLGHATHHLARLHRSRPSLGLLTPLRPQLCVQDIPESLLKSKRPRLAEDPGGDGASIRAAWSTREANLTDALEKLRASAAQAAQSAIVSRGEIVSKERDVQAAREVANERDRAATQARAELSIAEASLQDAVAEEGGHTAAATQHQAKVFKLERLEKDDASVMMHQIHKRWLKENKEKKAAAVAAAASDAAAAASGVDTAAAASGGAAAAASALAAAASGAAATASALAANSSAAAANSSAPPADNSSGGGQPLGGEGGAVTSWIEGVTGGREAEDFRHSEMVLELRRITNELTAQLGVEKEWMKLPEASEELDYDYEGLSRLESLVEAFEAEVQAADEYLADEADDEADEAEAGRVEEKNKNIEKLKALNLKMQGLLAQADDQRKNGEWVAVGATNREIAPVRREIESVRGLLDLRKGDAVPEPLAPPPALLGPPAGPLAPPAALHAPPAGPLAQPAAPLAPAAPLGPAEPEPPEAAPSAAAAAPSVVVASATVSDTSAAPAAAASAASSVSS